MVEQWPDRIMNQNLVLISLNRCNASRRALLTRCPSRYNLGDFLITSSIDNFFDQQKIILIANYNNLIYQRMSLKHINRVLKYSFTGQFEELFWNRSPDTNPGTRCQNNRNTPLISRWHFIVCHHRFDSVFEGG